MAEIDSDSDVGDLDDLPASSTGESSQSAVPSVAQPLLPSTNIPADVNTEPPQLLQQQQGNLFPTSTSTQTDALPWTPSSGQGQTWWAPPLFPPATQKETNQVQLSRTSRGRTNIPSLVRTDTTNAPLRFEPWVPPTSADKVPTPASTQVSSSMRDSLANLMNQLTIATAGDTVPKVKPGTQQAVSATVSPAPPFNPPQIHGPWFPPADQQQTTATGPSIPISPPDARLPPVAASFTGTSSTTLNPRFEEDVPPFLRTFSKPSLMPRASGQLKDDFRSIVSSIWDRLDILLENLGQPDPDSNEESQARNYIAHMRQNTLETTDDVTTFIRHLSYLRYASERTNELSENENGISSKELIDTIGEELKRLYVTIAASHLVADSP